MQHYSTLQVLQTLYLMNLLTSRTYRLQFRAILKSRKGVFETIEGSLSSEWSKQKYTITVDYSIADEYCIGLLRTGTGGFDVTVYDSAGEQCGKSECWGPYSVQVVRNMIKLTKPTGASGEYTYTVEVSTTASKFVAGDVSYRLAYGEASQKYYFFEDVSDCMDLPYFHSVRNRVTQIEPDYEGSAPLSEYGDYYKITATGAETVTLSSSRGQYDFKILDCTSFEILYDSSHLTAFKPEGSGSIYPYGIRVDINFAPGHQYYVVVYEPNGGADWVGDYSITVGEPALLFGNATFNMGSASFVKGNTYTWSFTVNTPTGRNAYLDGVSYHATAAGWPMEGGYFSVLTPGASSWRTNSPMYYTTIDYKFDDLNVPLVTASGDWKIRIVAGKTGTYPGSTVGVGFWFEV